MKALLVDPDPRRAPALAEALAAGGVEVAMARSASFALTMLEWHRQDVIVSRARLGDMEGHELCAIVRSDPATKEVRFVLVVGTGEVAPGQTTAAGVDLMLPDALSSGTIAARVVQLVRRQVEMTAPRVPVVAPAPVPPPVPVVAPVPVVTPVPPVPVVTPAPVVGQPPPAAVTAASAMAGLEAVGHEGGTRTFQGALGVLELEELTQAIAVGGKTGRLVLVLAAGGGLVVFEGGRLTHAEFGGLAGEPAFGALVAAAHRERAGKFCFIPISPSELRNQPKTIVRGVDQLLLDAATAMDEERPA
jgi:CheY-like chemotaxis protein